MIGVRTNNVFFMKQMLTVPAASVVDRFIYSSMHALFSKMLTIILLSI